MKPIFILLFAVFLPLFAKEQTELSAQEKKWIKNNPIFILGSDSNWSPYIIKNKDGSISGYDKDILDLVNKYTGANFQLTAGRWKDMLESAKAKKIDGLSTSAVHKKREEYFNFSTPYVSTQRLLVVANNNPKNILSLNDLEGKRIGYQEKNLFDKKLVSKFKNSIHVPLKSLEDVLENLITGKIDATLGSHAIIYMANKKGLPYIKIIDYIPHSTLDLVFSIRNDQPEALSILNKGLNKISLEERISLKNKWFFRPGKNFNEKNGFSLSKEEKNYLDNKPYISVMSLENFQPFSFRIDNEPKGYSVDLIKLMGKSLNKEIRFIKKPWNEQLEMLKKGELDIIPHIAVNEKRKKFVDYTKFVHLTFMIGFATSKDQTLKTMDDLHGKKLAVVKGYYLHDHIKKSFPEIELLPLSSTEAAIQAVAKGDAFAVVDNIPTLNYFIQEKWLSNLKVATVSGFGLPMQTNMPMGVTKGNIHLKSILEKLNNFIPREEHAKLKSLWFNMEQKRRIDLSKKEKLYLDKKGQIKMCIDPDWMPFEAIINGEHIGMTSEYFKILEESIGFPIKMVPTKSWSESLEYGKARKCDIFSLVMPTTERKEYLDFTKTYFKTPLVLATELHRPWMDNLNEIKEQKVGIVKGYAYGEILRKKYPNMNLIEVKNIEEGLEKVERGKLYGFIGTLATVGYHVQQNHIGQIKITGKFKEKWELGIGTRNDEPHLHNIFNKAIATISKEEHQSILNKWVSIKLNDDNQNRLTAKESNFLKENPKIKFLVRSSRPPFEFEKDDKAVGIAVDYIRAISKKLGFEAEFVLKDISFKEAYKEVKEGSNEVDTLLFMVKNDKRMNDFTFGEAYLSYPMMIITHKNAPYIGKLSDLNGKNVAIEKGYLTNKWIKRDYPGINIISVKSTIDALKAVNNEKADAYIGNMAVANYMIVQGELNNIKIAAPSDYGTIDYRFTSPNNIGVLSSILSKGYNKLTPSEHNLIQQKWFSLQTIERIDYNLIWKIVAGSFIIILWILWWSRRMQLEKNKTEAALEDLKKAQEKLQEQKEEFEAIFESSQEGIAILDLDSKFILFNDTYSELTGYSEDELLDKTCIELSIPEDKEKSIDVIKRVKRGEVVKNFEKSCIAKNGKRLTINMSLSLLPDKKRILISTKDMTQIKKLEEQAKLVSLGEMIGNIAHQWRQPLNIISTYVSSVDIKLDLDDKIDKEYLRDCSKGVSKQVQFLSKTIDDFRNFIKEQDIIANTDIKETLQSSLNILNPTFVNNDITLIADIEDTITIKGNKNELSQALINIFNNSKDALNESLSKMDDRYIFVTTNKINGTTLQIKIKDNGGGIPNDIINRIFEPYFTTKHQSIGTGLGLSMVDKIIRERHKAEIEVFNEEYQYNGETYTGACFLITFYSNDKNDK